jgi:antitoxin component HigA of HigAB toxin-antitoxin module
MPTLDELNKRESSDQVVARLLMEIASYEAREPHLADALEFRREAYGLSMAEFALVLGIAKSSYTEILRGNRHLTRKAQQRAYVIGVIPDALLQPTKKGIQ